ncbi:MAG: hypothetical protein QOE90_2752 [Thermoplasmata archaeon]|nr:hypothetical protein [Thermoplasmata archaeon]
MRDAVREDEAAVEKAYAAERALAGLRFAIILLNSLVYAFLMPKDGTSPALAYAVIVLANAYGIGVVAFQPYKRFPVLASSYFTTALDAVFISVWLAVTGGLHSPFYPLWLVSTTAVAFRYGWLETLFAAAVYCASDLLMITLLGSAGGHASDLVVREAYIMFTAAAGALFARESVRQTEEKIEMRRLADALRESEERFRRLSDATFEGVAIHEDGTILEANAAFARLFGYGPDEVAGLTAFDIVAPEDHETIRHRIASRDDAPYEVKGRRRDGTRFDAEITARDLPHEGRSVRVVAIRDVSERSTAQRLRELDAMKTQFINNAAHELGTPLTPIKLQAHLLRSDSGLSDKQRRSVDVLNRNVEHLSLMVRDLLDASRVQTGKLSMNPAEVDVPLAVAQAVESFAEAARLAGVKLEARAEPGLRVRADAARVAQVLLNLVGNAIKFTPAGGRIEVSARREGNEVVVRVADTGAGLSRDQIERLFRPFSQVHDRAGQSRSGTGLGLYISRGIVEQHGGRIWAASDGLGMGSTFAFALPAA